MRGIFQRYEVQLGMTGMEILLSVFALFFLIAIIIGLINPSKVNLTSRKDVLLGCGVPCLIFAAMLTMFGEDDVAKETIPSTDAAVTQTIDEPPASMEDMRDEVKSYFISVQEPKVLDAAWTADEVFKVGVIDDGSVRDKYAEYVCLILYDHGFKGMHIYTQVIDIEKLNKTGEWLKLGESFCD